MLDSKPTHRKDIVVDLETKLPLPRPIHERRCACKCGYLFQPNRNDQIYLNKQHADFAYSHGRRKTKDAVRKKVENILLKNDNILHKHYCCENKSGPVEVFIDVLKADGFDMAYSIGRNELGNTIYAFSYRYKYTLHRKTEIKKIKIFKR